MELTHRFTVPVPVDRAWETFTDLESVGSCFPGAVVTSADETEFAGTVKVKLGPIALQYSGTGRFVERDDAAHRAVLEAKGKDKRGNGTAGATVRIALDPEGEGTVVDVTTDLAVTGKPAQFGRGVMQDVSDTLLQRFVACIEGRFAETPTSPEDAARPSPDAADVASDRDRSSDGDLPSGVPSTSDGPVSRAASGRATARQAGRPAPDVAPAVAQREGPPARVETTPSPSPADRSGAPVPRPAGSRPAAPRSDDDAVDLGATVLPVLARAYRPYVAVGVAGLVIGWLVGRRRGRRDR
ncbi:MAG: SRPBCC domain-containing protein [Phycicoccus sp.]